MKTIRKVAFKEEVRTKQLEGAKIVHDVVASTAGAKGKLVAIQNRYDENYLSKDGHYSANTIFLEDPVENIGASMIKEAARKAAITGDGTTTTTILTYKMYEKGVNAISNGANPVDIKKGMEFASLKVIKQLNKNKIDFTNDMIRHVATVSANNSEEIGGHIVEARNHINEEGTILVEESIGNEASIESIDGMRFDKGYVSQYFVTDEERMTCELEKVYIAVVYGSISTFKQISPLAEFVMKEQKSLLIIGLETNNEALATLVRNKVEAGFKVVSVNAPGVGMTRKTWLDDIAASCGATVISEDAGKSLEDFNPDMLGSAKKVKVTRDDTTIIGGAFDPREKETRVNTIREQIKNAKKTDNVELYKNRLAKLDGGVSIIKIGATTEVELREKKDLYEDAIAAVKSATDGVLPGGGSSLAHASKCLKDISSGNNGEEIGIRLIEEVLCDPLLTIMGNAGLDNAEILKSVLENDSVNWGYNLNTGEYCDMIKDGIIDTLVVEVKAVENSVSIASLMLNTETVIYNAD